MNDRPEPPRPHQRLIVKLESIAKLNSDDKAALAEMPFRLRDFPENSDLVLQGDVPPECCLIVEGFVARYKLIGQGRRQITSLHVPGDIPDLQSLHLKTMDHSIVALTPVRAAFIPHEAMNELTHQRPSLADVLWRDTLIDAAVFREWLANVGRRNARERIAHLLCEFYLRLRSVGMAAEGEFEFPMTQAELADAVGLSPVHVNRVLQELRAEGLIATRGRMVAVRDWDRLKASGDFEPGYLHFVERAA